MANRQIIKIRELDPDMIAPSTKTHSNPQQGGSKIVIIGKPGCFKKDTPVLMYDGSLKKVQDVEVGDQVMGDDNKPRNVLELFHDTDKMFDIIPKNGGKYNVNYLHDLVLLTPSDEIIEMSVKEFLTKHSYFKNNCKIFKSIINFPEKSVDLDPYLLGQFLRLDKTYTSIFEEWISTRGQQFNKYMECKNIPTEYKINCQKIRLQLLAGLLDIDSYYNIKTHTYEVFEKNKEMVDDMVYIVRSLGFSIIVKKCIRHTSIYYKLIIYGDVEQIPSKNIKYTKFVGNKNHLYSEFRIKYTGIDEYFGFSLDGNKRFVLGTFDVVRNTGKSTLITSLLYEKSHIFPTGVVMSGTEDSNHHYSQIFPSTFVYNRLEKDRIVDFIKRQKVSKEHLENPWSVLLLDDCTDDPKLFSDSLFQGIFKNGRHWKMWFILSLQYCMDVKPVIRTNIDGTFILRETNLKNRRSLWENYAGVIPDFNMFCNIMDQITTDYTALYIHNATTSNNIEDCVFWYKAKPVPKNFKFGSDDFWKFHNKRFDESYTNPVI